jgi:ADP-ribose pyrophosphatase
MDTVFSSRIFKVVKKIVTGRSGKPLERYVVIHPGAVAVLPILDDGRFVLIKQYRVAVDEPLIEIPAGTLEPNEEPQVTAHRELIEETGYTAGVLTPTLQFYTSPGMLKEPMHLFVAEKLTAGPTAMEDGEQIETLLVEPEKAMKMIATGEIQDAKTIIALLWWKAKI